MSAHSESHHAGGHHAEAHAEHEHGGPAVYATTLIILLILTGITVGAAYIDLGTGNIVVALVIATIKATLVALFFMHLKWDKPVNRIIAISGFLFLGIFLTFDLIDMNARNYYLPQNVHRTEVPLVPGTAPRALTEILPDSGEPGISGETAKPGEAKPGEAKTAEGPAATGEKK